MEIEKFDVEVFMEESGGVEFFSGKEVLLLVLDFFDNFDFDEDEKEKN